MTEDFAVTQNAAKRLAFLITQEADKNVRMRVEVLGGGCSGFQYNFYFDAAKNEDDKIFTTDGVEVVVDEGPLMSGEESELEVRKRQIHIHVNNQESLLNSWK